MQKTGDDSPLFCALLAIEMENILDQAKSCSTLWGIRRCKSCLPAALSLLPALESDGVYRAASSWVSHLHLLLPATHCSPLHSTNPTMSASGN